MARATDVCVKLAELWAVAQPTAPPDDAR
jgi:hypothetical protein